MTAHHHPREETVAAFAAGTLDLGRSIVVAAHLESCPACQRMAAAIGEIGGQHIASLQETALSPAARRKTLEQLVASPAPRATPRRRNNLPEAPASLHPYELGPWRWISRGVYTCTASVPALDGARVFLLKAAPGTKLPRHTHTGNELTLVLKGAFAHQFGRYAAGDLDDADDSIQHQPIVEAGDECICLVAMEGQLRLLGLTAPIFQPFVRLG